MKNYNAYNWQEFSLKKDIEAIVRNTKQSKLLNTGVLIDFLLLLVGIIIEHLYPVSELEKKIYITILVIIAILSLSIVWIERVIAYIKERLGHKSFRIKNSIDKFDNEISYYIMTSKSFQDLLDKCKQDTDVNIKVFYFTQMCFYRNKAVYGIYDMINMLQDIFDLDVRKIISYKKISMLRLENIIKLILEINRDITDNMCVINTYESQKIFQEENKYANDRFKEICDKIISELGMKL